VAREESDRRLQVKELVEAFRALRHAPRALWMVIFAFSAEMMAYVGVLTLMASYLTEDIGIRKEYASWWVSAFTGSLSLVMLFVGKPLDARVGVRRGVLLALALILVGRALYASAPVVGVALIALALAVMSFGEGVLQPITYSGIKRYTDEKNGPMGYAVLYAFFNLGVALVGPLSAKVRTTWDAKHAAGASALTGFQAVNWVCTGLVVLTLAFFAAGMTKKAAAAVVRGDAEEAAGAKSAGPSPFQDKRFLFFIFALLPVRTLFAHQWLTMPQYVLRAYPPEVADRMEWLVDSTNPAIIFFGVPIITALTKKYNVLTMMIAGTSVTALSSFLLVPGPHTPTLIAYFFLFSIGEAMWSSRFYEYAAELAPKGRTAQYMGVASLPWFLAKTTTGLYSGFVLEAFCPKDGPKNTGMIWLLYGLVAVSTPLALTAARRWLRAGM
jgi:MFS family permease